MEYRLPATEKLKLGHRFYHSNGDIKKNYFVLLPRNIKSDMPIKIHITIGLCAINSMRSSYLHHRECPI